ncbi:unnamed protein product [Vitrella brassicaformis CCMP3155]|uniref:Uncharacterized protein n=2 Tax=Vitrella brassicaformis TaxID=1169539 RepID=A0A0G4H1T3_VITBC|nr:unnamed protein product [Vitrella brassicaformis CCMP3155]|eukprot:CEM37586.1 unnamed protein product [Vitrella brassicaformis CCMP3155]
MEPHTRVPPGRPVPMVSPPAAQFDPAAVNGGRKRPNEQVGGETSQDHITLYDAQQANGQGQGQLKKARHAEIAKVQQPVAQQVQQPHFPYLPAAIAPLSFQASQLQSALQSSSPLARGFQSPYAHQLPMAHPNPYASPSHAAVYGALQYTAPGYAYPSALNPFQPGTMYPLAPRYPGTGTIGGHHAAASHASHHPNRAPSAPPPLQQDQQPLNRPPSVPPAAMASHRHAPSSHPPAAAGLSAPALAAPAAGVAGAAASISGSAVTTAADVWRSIQQSGAPTRDHTREAIGLRGVPSICTTRRALPDTPLSRDALNSMATALLFENQHLGQKVAWDPRGFWHVAGCCFEPSPATFAGLVKAYLDGWRLVHRIEWQRKADEARKQGGGTAPPPQASAASAPRALPERPMDSSEQEMRRFAQGQANSSSPVLTHGPLMQMPVSTKLPMTNDMASPASPAPQQHPSPQQHSHRPPYQHIQPRPADLPFHVEAVQRPPDQGQGRQKQKKKRAAPKQPRRPWPCEALQPILTSLEEALPSGKLGIQVISRTVYGHIQGFTSGNPAMECLVIGGCGVRTALERAINWRNKQAGAKMNGYSVLRGYRAILDQHGWDAIDERSAEAKEPSDALWAARRPTTLPIIVKLRELCAPTPLYITQYYHKDTRRLHAFDVHLGTPRTPTGARQAVTKLVRINGRPVRAALEEAIKVRNEARERAQAITGYQKLFDEHDWRWEEDEAREQSSPAAAAATGVPGVAAVFAARPNGTGAAHLQQHMGDMRMGAPTARSLAADRRIAAAWQAAMNTARQRSIAGLATPLPPPSPSPPLPPPVRPTHRHLVSGSSPPFAPLAAAQARSSDRGAVLPPPKKAAPQPTPTPMQTLPALTQEQPYQRQQKAPSAEPPGAQPPVPSQPQPQPVPSPAPAPPKPQNGDNKQQPAATTDTEQLQKMPPPDLPPERVSPAARDDRRETANAQEEKAEDAAEVGEEAVVKAQDEAAVSEEAHAGASDDSPVRQDSRALAPPSPPPAAAGAAAAACGGGADQAEQPMQQQQQEQQEQREVRRLAVSDITTDQVLQLLRAQPQPDLKRLADKFDELKQSSLTPFTTFEDLVCLVESPDERTELLAEVPMSNSRFFLLRCFVKAKKEEAATHGGIAIDMDMDTGDHADGEGVEAMDSEGVAALLESKAVTLPDDTLKQPLAELIKHIREKDVPGSVLSRLSARRGPSAALSSAEEAEWLRELEGQLRLPWHIRLKRPVREMLGVSSSSEQLGGGPGAGGSSMMVVRTKTEASD